MVRKRGLPGTGCLAILCLKRTRTDFSPVGGLFLLFNFYLQLSYDRLSFDGGVLTNASGITFFLDNGWMRVYFSLFSSFSCEKTSVLKVRFFYFHCQTN